MKKNDHLWALVEKIVALSLILFFQNYFLHTSLYSCKTFFSKEIVKKGFLILLNQLLLKIDNSFFFLQFLV